MILALVIAGCDLVETPTEKIVVEESEEEVAGEEEGSKIAVEEITGNTNILSGLEISDTVKDDRPIALMVENTPDARPQSGLIYADMVFEVVDEYGITRFVVVYSSYEADIVGPVRSARIYYAEIARSLDPVYAFWGTYPECFDVIKALDNLGLYDDVLRSVNGKHIRAGRGKTRGRKYKTPKSILIVAMKDEIEKSSKNISGIDIVKPDQINIEHLAPGGDPGRLAIFTKSALKVIGGAK